MARALNGTNQTLSRADATALRVAFPLTVGMWWKGSTPPTFAYMLSKVSLAGNFPSYGIGLDSSQVLRGIIGWGASSGNFTVATGAGNGGAFDGNPHYIALTYDGANIKVSVDGSVTASTTETRAVVYSTGSLYIGSFDGTQLWAASTGVAEVSIWSAALAADDLVSLVRGFDAQLIRPDKLVAHWSLLGRNSPEVEIKKALDLTVTGATQAAHPRIISPGSTLILRNKNSAVHSATLGIAGETDAAIRLNMAMGLNQALETDTAVALTRKHARTVGIATETDTAIRLNMLLGLNKATETDTALALTRAKKKTLGIAAETDTAVQLGMRLGLNPATETDTARTLTTIKARLLGAAPETDSARPLGTTHKVKILGPALEADEARPVSHPGMLVLGAAAETDAAVALARRHARALGLADETDLARALSHAVARLLGVASETDTALVVVASGGAQPTVVTVTPMATCVRPGPLEFRREQPTPYRRGGILSYQR